MIEPVHLEEVVFGEVTPVTKLAGASFANQNTNMFTDLSIYHGKYILEDHSHWPFRTLTWNDCLRGANCVKKVA